MYAWGSFRNESSYLRTLHNRSSTPVILRGLEHGSGMLGYSSAVGDWVVQAVDDTFQLNSSTDFELSAFSKYFNLLTDSYLRLFDNFLKLSLVILTRVIFLIVMKEKELVTENSSVVPYMNAIVNSINTKVKMNIRRTCVMQATALVLWS